MISGDMILIASYYIHKLIARIPVVVIELRGPHINQVVHAMTHQVTLHEQIQLLEGAGTITTPPEPCVATTVGIASSLVKRAPDNGDALLLVVKQQAGDTLQITHQHSILWHALLQRPARRECGAALWCFGCRRRIERIALAIGHQRINRHTPMPNKAYNTPRLIPILGCIGQIVDMLQSEMLEIEDIHCWILTCAFAYFVGIGRVIIPSGLTTRQYLFAPNIVSQIVVQANNLFGGFLIYRFWGYLCRQMQQRQHT